MNFLISFMNLTVATCVLFFISVGSYEPVVKMLRYFNNKNIDHPLNEWLIFVPTAIVAALVWCAAYIYFKYSERRCTEVLKSYFHKEK